jgi:hypothetical protein
MNASTSYKLCTCLCTFYCLLRPVWLSAKSTNSGKSTLCCIRTENSTTLLTAAVKTVCTNKIIFLALNMTILHK